MDKRFSAMIAATFLSLSIAGGAIAAGDKAYFDEISKKIITQYKVPGGFEVVHAKVGFEVDAKGNVGRVTLLSDDDAPAEGQSVVTRTAMIKAIKKAAPFPPPGELKTPVKLVAEFERNQSGEGVSCKVEPLMKPLNK
ncbi:MAG TPA: hypothetical protein V6D17_10900 [Candidatus Obscuribacterales bacterium]